MKLCIVKYKIRPIRNKNVIDSKVSSFLGNWLPEFLIGMLEI